MSRAPITKGVRAVATWLRGHPRTTGFVAAIAAIAITWLSTAGRSSTDVVVHYGWGALALAVVLAIPVAFPDLSPVADFIGAPGAGADLVERLRLPGFPDDWDRKGARRLNRPDGTITLRWSFKVISLTPAEINPFAPRLYSELEADAHTLTSSRKRWWRPGYWEINYHPRPRRDLLAEPGAVPAGVLLVSRFGARGAAITATGGGGATPSKAYPMTCTYGPVDDRGNLVPLPIVHGLVFGATGSGKSSALHSDVRSTLPYVAGGYAQLWGCDPKRAELIGDAAALFHRLAYSPADIVSTVSDLHDELLRRQGVRTFVPTPEQPSIHLHIDEITSLPLALDRREWDEFARLLKLLLLQSRSSRIQIKAYGHDPTKAATEFRDLFIDRVCLRMPTASDVDLVLGHGSVAAGAHAHLIPIASEMNGYASAGLGYLRTGDSRITRIRFPMTTDADLARLARMYGLIVKQQRSQ